MLALSFNLTDSKLTQWYGIILTYIYHYMIYRHTGSQLSQIVYSSMKLSSYPYPPDFLAWMRQLFANPQPFIDACIQQYVPFSLFSSADWKLRGTAE